MFLFTVQTSLLHIYAIRRQSNPKVKVFPSCHLLLGKIFGFGHLYSFYCNNSVMSHKAFSETHNTFNLAASSHTVTPLNSSLRENETQEAGCC